MSHIIQNNLNILTSPSLNEALLSAIVRKINKENVSAISIFSPFRKERDVEENEENYKQLKSEISNNGWGYLQLEGGWKENKDTPSEVIVVEKSVFIEVPKSDEEKLWKFSMNQCQVYNQDGFIFYSYKKPFGVYTKRGHTSFLFSGKQIHKTDSGKEYKLNKISFSDIEDMYSTLRFGSDSKKKFVFEGIYEKSAFTMIEAMTRKNWTNL